jgi:hypothetical protein
VHANPPSIHHLQSLTEKTKPPRKKSFRSPGRSIRSSRRKVSPSGHAQCPSQCSPDTMGVQARTSASLSQPQSHKAIYPSSNTISDQSSQHFSRKNANINHILRTAITDNHPRNQPATFFVFAAQYYYSLFSCLITITTSLSLLRTASSGR